VKKMDSTGVRIFALIFTLLSALFFALWVAIPLVNTSGPAYNVPWAMLFSFGVTNFLLISLAMATVADPDNPMRVDLHQILSLLALVVNILFVIACVLLYYTWINASFAGTEQFNDYREWCCSYYVDHPDICPNLGPCQNASGVLTANREYYVHLIAGCVGIFVAFFNLGINRMLRISGVAPPATGRVVEGVVFGVVFTGLIFVAFCYWAAWPLLNTLYIHGYPTLAIPPSPGTFESYRYNFSWWCVWMLVSNVAPPFLFMAAIIVETNRSAQETHFWMSIIAELLSFTSFAGLLFIWLTNCNWSWSAGSLCASYQWCCDNYPNAIHICANVGPCPTSPTLYPNAEFVQHLIFAGVFSVVDLIWIWLNFRMRKYNVFFS
jgi:hypothetical protein